MKVVILAGGLGTRLSEYTHVIPKPMVKIGPYPIIAHIMNHYLRFGFNDFIIATGYKNFVFKKYFKNFKRDGDEFEAKLFNKRCKINILDTGKETLTGGRLKRVSSFLEKNKDFMFTYGDGLSSVNLNKLTKFHKNKNKLIFDGYPRSLSQAENLDLLLTNSDQKIDFIFFLNVKKDTIIKRIEKRKLLEKRSDDNFITILKRYDTYMETTKPVLDFYSKKPNFYEIDGDQKIDQISNKIEHILTV